MFNSLSDPYLIVAFWGGVVSVGLTLVVAVLVIFLRMRMKRRRRHWDRFVALWRPVLAAAMLDPDFHALPLLRRRQAVHFVRLWAHLHESVRGESVERLNAVALQLGVDAAARRLLRRRSRSRKLLAILCVGHLRDAKAWDDLLVLARDPDPLVSVNAARSLIQVDALKGAEQLMPLVLSRADWDVTRVAGFLAPARDAFWLLLVRSIPQVPQAQLVRALRLGDALRLTLPPATLHYLLDDSLQPAAVIAEALRLAGTPELAAAVRRCLNHADRRVREQAARQLAVVGGPGDVALLAGLLLDRDWPVRLAATQALVAMPFLDEDQLQALRPSDPASAQIFTHVLAERHAA